MSDLNSVLEKTRSIATILSAIAIPAVLGLVGYTVQQSIAEDGIKKDYLTMAMNMLREGGDKLDPSLKAWATTVVSKYSPVPFTPEAQNRLGAAISLEPYVPPLPEVARQVDLGALCAEGCSAAMMRKYDGWQKNLANKKGDEAIKVLQDILDKSIQQNVELAGALDRATIAGNACTDSYEAVRGILEK